jgi:hypothetical protein
LGQVDLLAARERLKDLCAPVRRAALMDLMTAEHLGQATYPPDGGLVNMHCHTFFSYNGYAHSPTSLAWLAHEQGWHALGTVDFDVLDGVEECLEACDHVGVRGAAGLETRVFVPEFATREINSPGEPGVCYHMGAGFVSAQAPAEAAQVLHAMRRRAVERNRDMVARINAHLAPVTIDYERDVLPLTPAGNATERHILLAYDAAARQRFPEREALCAYWAGKLSVDSATVAKSIGDAPTPNELLRSKLMKRGGVGYVQPGPSTFPPVEEVNRAIVACGAIPVYTWLDGASAGEQAIAELLPLMVRQGAAAINIIPDRNWNLPDAAQRAEKVRALYAIIALAREMDLVILVGTEMNKAGQRLMDDFDAEPLRPLRADFVRGADFIYGHTVLQRALGIGYQSAWARAHLSTRRERNAFYAAVGAAVKPGFEMLTRVAQLDVTQSPQAILARLEALG